MSSSVLLDAKNQIFKKTAIKYYFCQTEVYFVPKMRRTVLIKI